MSIKQLKIIGKPYTQGHLIMITIQNKEHNHIRT